MVSGRDTIIVPHSYGYGATQHRTHAGCIRASTERFQLLGSGLRVRLTVMNVAHTQVRHPAAVTVASIVASSAAYLIVFIPALAERVSTKIRTASSGGAR